MQHDSYATQLFSRPLPLSFIDIPFLVSFIPSSYERLMLSFVTTIFFKTPSYVILCTPSDLAVISMSVTSSLIAAISALPRSTSQQLHVPFGYVPLSFF